MFQAWLAHLFNLHLPGGILHYIMILTSTSFPHRHNVWSVQSTKYITLGGTLNPFLSLQHSRLQAGVKMTVNESDEKINQYFCLNCRWIKQLSYCRHSNSVGERRGGLEQWWRSDEIFCLSQVSRAPIPNFAFTQEPRWANHSQTVKNGSALCCWSHHFLYSFRPLVLFCYGVFLT